jgi:hypothetical protein
MAKKSVKSENISIIKLWRQRKKNSGTISENQSASRHGEKRK